MEELRIQLTYNPDHFKEIYYQNGEAGILTFKPTRKAIKYVIISALFTVIIYFASYIFPDISWLIIMGLISIFFTVIYALIVIIKHQHWKNKTESYLKDLAQYKLYNIHLTSHAIEVALDEKTFIEKWESIKSVQIFNTYIFLYKSDVPSFLFPAKSMRREEYEQLKDFIKSKIMTTNEVIIH